MFLKQGHLTADRQPNDYTSLQLTGRNGDAEIASFDTSTEREVDTEGTRDRPTVSDSLHSTSALVGGTTANNDVIERGDDIPNRTSQEPTNTTLPDNTSDVTDGDASSDVSRISASSNDYVSLSSKPVIQDSLYDHAFLLNANIV